MIRPLRGRGDFSRNIMTLMTGSILAQSLPIAISPVLTRIYTPDEFGVFAIFAAMLTVLGSIANARYELAIILPEDDKDAIRIVALGIFLAFGFSLILLVFISIFTSEIAGLLGDERVAVWLYFIPLAVFVLGTFNSLQYLNNRFKQYRNIAKVNVIKSLSLVLVQLCVGIFKGGVAGLILGQLSSYLSGNISLLKGIKIQAKFKRSDLGLYAILAIAKRYKEFPIYSAPAMLANTISIQLNSLIISPLFGVSTLGIYSLIQRVFGAPSLLIGNSFREVYFQKANQNKLNVDSSVKNFWQVTYSLTLLGGVIFSILFSISPLLFSFVFGSEWQVAGEYSRILIPFFFMRFIAVPISVVLTVYEKQKLSLLWQVGLLSLNFLLVLLAKIYCLDFDEYLYSLSILNSLAYLALGYLSYNCIKTHKKE